MRSGKTEELCFGGTKNCLKDLEIFAERIGFTIGWKREQLGAGKRASEEWKRRGSTKIYPQNPYSKWTKPE